MTDAFDDSQVKHEPIRWVKTSWKDQGEVCILEGRVWYIDVPDCSDGPKRMHRRSISLEEWYNIPDEDKKPKEEPDEDGKSTRYRRRRSNNNRPGKGLVVRKRSPRIVRNK